MRQGRAFQTERKTPARITMSWPQGDLSTVMESEELQVGGGQVTKKLVKGTKRTASSPDTLRKYKLPHKAVWRFKQDNIWENVWKTAQTLDKYIFKKSLLMKGHSN